MSKDAVNTAMDASRTDASQAPADAGDAGYSKALKSRHINMIAIGGAIGTGLFLGAGGRLHDAGPALVFAYLICGIFAYFVVRALGEMVVYRPSSGSFVSYAREFLGEKGAYVAGWMYFLNWSMTGIADITAVALYTQYWSAFTSIPQWVLALIALAVVLAVRPFDRDEPVALPTATMSPVRSAPVFATVGLENVAWGTKVNMHCMYERGKKVYGDGKYYLVVIADDGEVEHLGSWTVQPGKDAKLQGATSRTVEDISAVEIRTSTGRPVLRLHP